MRRLALSILFASSLASADPRPAPAPSVARPTADQLARPDVVLETHRVRLWAAAQPAVRAKLDPAIKALLARADVTPKPGEPAVDLWADAKKSAAQALPGASATEVEAAALLALLQAAKATQDDLNALLARKKARQLVLDCKGDAACIGKLVPTPEISRPVLDDAIDTVKNRQDTLTELGETEALRLRADMERRSKFLEMLSNLLKKASDTSTAIVSNLK